MRKYIQDAWDESDDPDGGVVQKTGHRPLEDGELPPYDSDAT